ncbi:MAG: NFACT RNA binding domain-containing protein [Myxococcota bacterium]
MSLGLEELDAVIAELERELVGAVVQKVFLPLPKLAYLELRVPGESVLLCLCTEPGRARVSVATERFPSPKEPRSFQMRLRHELIGARLVKVERMERTVGFTFEREGKAHRLMANLGRGGGFSLNPPLSLGEGGGEGPILKGSPPLSLSRAVEWRFADVEKSARASEVRKHLLAPLRTQRTRLLRTLEKVRAEASRQEDAERHRRFGELLAQNLHRVKKGAKTVRLTEYAADGERELSVPLDPTLSPKDQVERHFRQYRRLLRGCEHAQRRLGELTEQLVHLDAAIAEVKAREEESLLSQPEVLAEAHRPKGPAHAKPYKEYLSSFGERILVGKGAAANEALTFRTAKPNDLWLHARGHAGAHVVVPLSKSALPHPDTVLDAAHLAVHHSAAKGESLAEVSYTPVKYVRKVKGGAPGQVTYSREKTLRVRLEPARLTRLLQSREDGPS